MTRKRTIDLAMSAIVLVVAAPLMVIIALAIKLDSPGPALFRQTRIGRGGTLFRILKFRTMAHQANPHAFGVMLQKGAMLQTGRNDRRVTRVGTFLRRHSLDELPQIFNVLRGEMSFVGPRPHAVAMTVEGVRAETLVPGYRARLAVRPGMTGWAQIQGRRGILDNAAAVRELVGHDLSYIDHCSLALDIAILARTIGRVCRDVQAF